MGMPIEKRWTANEVRDLPDDGNRYEVIDGVLLVSPSPRLLHQRAILSLRDVLNPFVKRFALGELLHSPADIEFAPNTMVQPDLFVMPLDAGRRQREWNQVRGLVLAIEVLSPSTARHDRVIKRDRFMREQVADYWIVDLKARAIECWTPGARLAAIAKDRLSWQPAAAAEPLIIDLVTFFRDVCDD